MRRLAKSSTPTNTAHHHHCVTMPREQTPVPPPPTRPHGTLDWLPSRIMPACAPRTRSTPLEATAMVRREVSIGILVRFLRARKVVWSAQMASFVPSMARAIVLATRRTQSQAEARMSMITHLVTRTNTPVPHQRTRELPLHHSTTTTAVSSSNRRAIHRMDIAMDRRTAINRNKALLVVPLQGCPARTQIT
jgi:hypothetical protein